MYSLIFFPSVPKIKLWFNVLLCPVSLQNGLQISSFYNTTCLMCHPCLSRLETSSLPRCWIYIYMFLDSRLNWDSMNCNGIFFPAMCIHLYSFDSVISSVIGCMLCYAKISLLASLDLSAAFDTIDHAILLHRLQHDFGLSGTVLDWFSSYLSGRIQSVSVHSHTSVPASVSCGVPQGSVLGPILFVLYTTPLSAVIERHSILHHSYADDSQLQNSATPDCLPDLIDSMRLCIDDIKDWMTDNKLKLNDDKTEVMIISSSRMSTALSIPDSFDIGNASVPFSDTVKNLGVTLDCHLSLKTHVLNLVRTANFELRRIGSIRSLLTTEATVSLLSSSHVLTTVTLSSLAAPDLWFSGFKRFRTMQLVLSSGFPNVSIFPLTLPLFIGYPLIIASSTNLHVFATTLCQLTLRPTSLTFLLFTPLPVSFAHVLTTLSSVVHLSVPYPMVKDLSHTPPLLLGTLFLSRSALLIVSLLSDPERKLTFSVLPTNCLNWSVVICVHQSFISCVVGWVALFFCNVMSMFCDCNNVFATMCCNQCFL